MEKLRTPLILVLLAGILAGGVMFIIGDNLSSSSIEIVLPTPSGQIEVYVSGEVPNPGTYTIAESARIADAIEAAGGFTNEADPSSINLAAPLRDGIQINVRQTGQSSQLINVNTAEAWLLDALPGIGETMAQRIIEYRNENGPFASVEDLKQVDRLYDSTYEKIKDKITVR